MQRTDRLFDIITHLRAATAPVTARQLATTLEVTPRTIYRYIATLQSMRIPIQGAAGVGYIMRAGYDLPPLNFTADELESIIVGLGLLGRTGDAALQKSANRVLDKIAPQTVAIGSLQVSDWGIDAQPILAILRAALRDEEKLHITYHTLADTTQARTILPIVLTYYAEVAVLSAYCTLRDDFRNFRVDRIVDISTTGGSFRGQGADLRRKMQETMPPQA